MTLVVVDLTCVEGLFLDQDVFIHKPITVLCDSKLAIQLATSLIFHERTKYVEIDCHFIRDNIKDGLLKIVYITKQHQVEDMLTKILSHKQHSRLLGKLGVLKILHPSS